MAFEHYEARTPEAAALLAELERTRRVYDCIEGAGYAGFRGNGTAFQKASNEAFAAYMAARDAAQAAADRGEIVERQRVAA